MNLVKTAELDPEKTYVFGFHPHGIISMSAFITFATEALNVSKTFPGDLQHHFFHLAFSTAVRACYSMLLDGSMHACT